jgi:hypothetical protein
VPDKLFVVRHNRGIFPDSWQLVGRDKNDTKRSTIELLESRSGIEPEVEMEQRECRTNYVWYEIFVDFSLTAGDWSGEIRLTQKEAQSKNQKLRSRVHYFSLSFDQSSAVEQSPRIMRPTPIWWREELTIDQQLR